MVLYLKLDQKSWGQKDFTDSTDFDLSGTVYDDNRFTTARDISSYTGKFRLINYDGDEIFSSDQGLTLNANGTFSMKFAEGATPVIRGSYKVRIRLEKTGNRLTAVGVNGSDELFFEDE